MSEPKDLNKAQGIETGELALKCAQFFMSLSEVCYNYYQTYQTQKLRKTKMITKNRKNKLNNKLRRENENNDKGEDDLKKKLPKKPLTAYIIYFQQKKPEFVGRHPDLNLSELTKLIAKQWKQITEEDRKVYLDQAQEDRKRYQQELKEFKNRYGSNLVAQNEIQQEQPQLPKQIIIKENNSKKESQKVEIGSQVQDQAHKMQEQLPMEQEAQENPENSNKKSQNQEQN